MWQFVVCDDDEDCRREVVTELYNTLKKANIQEYNIKEYESLAQLYGSSIEPDVLLLDIAFQGEDDGSKVAVQLRRRWAKMQLIFVTSMENYIQNAFDAYSVVCRSVFAERSCYAGIGYCHTVFKSFG